MKVRLSIQNRMKLSELVAPEADSVARLKMFRDFQGELSLSEEEQKLVGLTAEQKEGKMLVYLAHPEKDPMKEFKIGEIITETICLKLSDLESNKALPADLLDLYLVFEDEIKKMGK